MVFPDSPLGQLARDYIEVYNGADDEEIRAFEAANRSAAALERRSLDDRIALYGQIRGMLGTIEAREIIEVTDGSLTLVVFSESAGGWFQLSFTLEEDPPHKLESIGIQPTGDPGAAELDLAGWETLGDLLETVLPEMGAPAIAAAFADRGGVVAVAARGTRQVDGDTPVRDDDTFHVGSVTKSITGTVIGALIEEGTLDPEATLASLLPGYELHPAYAKATLRQLLDHEAGFPPYTGPTPEQMQWMQGLEGTPTEQRAVFAGAVLAEEPVGSVGGFAYTNAGYSMLAVIAETATGRSWETLVEEFVFDPLELATAGFGWPATAEHPDQPRGHFMQGQTPVLQEFGVYELPSCLDPAGDIHMSAGDLALFARAHLLGVLGEDGLLTAATMETLHTPGSESGTYAAGWVVPDDGSGIQWHNGSAGSFYSYMRIDPETGTAGVVLINSGNLGAETLARRIVDEWTRRHTE